MTTIREQVALRSLLYHLATSALTKSISWGSGLITYIDNTYKEYLAGKFGMSKAWHVTTKFAIALITKVGKPREGALHSFEAGGWSINGKSDLLLSVKVFGRHE